MNVTLLASCVKCPGSLALIAAAIDEGHTVTTETVLRSDERTRRSAELGIGLPVLIDEYGAMSDDGKTWFDGTPNRRTKKTNPVVTVVDDANTN